MKIVSEKDLMHYVKPKMITEKQDKERKRLDNEYEKELAENSKKNNFKPKADLKGLRDVETKSRLYPDDNEKPRTITSAEAKRRDVLNNKNMLTDKEKKERDQLNMGNTKSVKKADKKKKLQKVLDNIFN